MRQVPEEQFVQGLRVPVDCPLHPRFSTFLACLVFVWGVTEVLCAVTDQGPRILLDFLCTSGRCSQLVLTSSGYMWISYELHAVRDTLVPSLRGSLFGALCAGTGPGGHVHRDMAPSIISCTY